MESLELIAPMVVMVLLILTIGGVILLKPVSKQAAALLEQMLKDRREGRATEDTAHLSSAMTSLSERLRLLEERQTFTESLLGSRSEPAERITSGVEGVESDR